MVAQRFENLYLETASSTIDTNFLESAVSILGPEKIIFGTDTPLLDPWTQLAKVRETAIDARAKDLICGGNIARLIGLS